MSDPDEQVTWPAVPRALPVDGRIDAWEIWQDDRGMMQSRRVGEIYFSPFRNSLVIREGFAMEKRAAGERDRREWAEGIRRRLGLVAEVHRCKVYRCNPGDWGWWCRREHCGMVGHFLPSQAEAVTAAQEQTRAFVPEPPEEEPLTELQWALYVAFSEDAERQREADEAAFGARIAAVTEQVGDAFAGILPEGMRFEWRTDGE